MGICASQLPATAAQWTAAPAFAKHYELDEKAVLAERPSAVIYKGKHRATGELVAVKRIHKLRASQQQQQQPDSALAAPQSSTWQNEVAVIKRCARHPNVIEFKQVFETRTDVLVVMEFIAGGELFDALISDGAYSEWDARRFVKDTLEALKFLHERNIIHRDIKPENLLFTSSDSKVASIKVVNFAMAKLADTASSPRSAAAAHEQLTWPYCAPEILATIGGFASRVASIRASRASSVTASDWTAPATGSDEDGGASASVSSQSLQSPSLPLLPLHEVSAKCDVWSVGIVLYVLLSGSHPFDLDGRQTRDQIVENILLGQFSMSDESSVWRVISREAKELLALLLETDPAKRPSAAEALEHDWFTSPHTPRTPLSVSVSDGLGQYQRLMRKKFRTSVLVAMAAETLRRSLRKHQEAIAAAAAASSGAPSVLSDANTTDCSSAGDGEPTSHTLDAQPATSIDASACSEPKSVEESVRRPELTDSSKRVEPLSSLTKQSSVLSRVFHKTSEQQQHGDAVDTRDVSIEAADAPAPSDREPAV